MKRAICWFRRDLRVADNAAFSTAARQAEQVLPLFILDDDILAAPDMGAARVAFLLDSLRNLQSNLRALGSTLTIRRGNAVEELARFCQETQAEAVFAGRNYEPFCVQRDLRVDARLNALGVGFELVKDAVIWEEREVLTRAGQPFSVFTPYAKAWHAIKPRPAAFTRPKTLSKPLPLASCPIPATSAELGYPLSQNIPAGGEDSGAKVLTDFLAQAAANYANQRDFPALAGTSRLSPHLHFGTIGIRSVLAGVERMARSSGDTAKQSAAVFINELVWREFYLQILANYPRVLNGCFRTEYDALPWREDKTLFQTWCAGQTGYPIVDAAMRCLNATGWMHNRLRMIVSMFLAKDLLLPWQWGERYFMQQLVDGDHAANNGGWQWSAGTGTDAAPYFRIFNPTTQGEKFDPEGLFIHQWLPELEALPGPLAHRPWDQPMLARKYPAPIVDHAQQRTACLALFQSVRGRH